MTLTPETWMHLSDACEHASAAFSALAQAVRAQLPPDPEPMTPDPAESPFIRRTAVEDPS